MKVDVIEKERNRVDVRRNAVRHILDWGKENDYPQSVIDIVNGSYTGVTCLDIYHKFIFGQGFVDADNYQIIVNEDGETADGLLDKVADDYSRFGGFAIHVNRNLLGQITSMTHVPMENVRICDPRSKDHKNQVALHPDWGRRSDRPFNETPIEYINVFDPNHDVFLERIEECGGIWNYRGEIYIYSNRGEGQYPLPSYDASLTDMSTQEAISNISYMNARHGFLPAGCFVEINEYYDDTNEDDRRAFDAVSQRLKELQGDKATSRIMHVIAKDKESVPAMISMKGENYDKEFSVTAERAEQSIGKAFRQPAELRCEKVASGFSNDTMVQAYKVYNSITSKERQTLEKVFSRLFMNWHQPLEYNFQIMPLAYGTETLLTMLGGDTASEVVELIKSQDVGTEQKKSIMTIVYGISEDLVNELLQIKKEV